MPPLLSRQQGNEGAQLPGQSSSAASWKAEVAIPAANRPGWLFSRAATPPPLPPLSLQRRRGMGATSKAAMINGSLLVATEWPAEGRRAGQSLSTASSC